MISASLGARTMSMLVPAHAYVSLAAAFCRGRLALDRDVDDATAITEGERAGLRLAKFKRNAELPRVRRVLGMLQQLAPASLLDVGSGRGTFLFPLIDAFPELAITAIDVDPQRASDLVALSRGGVHALSAAQMSVTSMTFGDASFDGVTALEVLEHLPDPESAIAACARVAERFVVLSVPSREDDNPEHLHVLDEARLRAAFARTSLPRLRCAYVPGHLVAVAMR